MKPITKLRFDALAGYSRSPQLPLPAQELAWFEDGKEKVLGILSLDRPDENFLYTILGRDKHGRFRAVDLEVDFRTKEEARARLETALAHAAMRPPEAFYQHDETGAPLDFFTPVVPEAKQPPPHFRQIITGSHRLPSFGLSRN